MADFRLYRDIFSVTINPEGVSTNVLITPTEISTFTSGATGTIETITPIEEITGRFYVNINVALYEFNTIYHLVWVVKYTQNSPTKNLITRFKFNPNINIGSDIFLEVISSPIPINI